MQRRPQVQSSPEEAQRDIDRMKRTLQLRSSPKPRVGSTAAPAGDEAAGDSLEQQQELLGRLTAAPPLPVDPQGPAPPLEPITAAPVRPQGYVDEPPTLEWLSPITHANGEKTQISQGGAYEVLGRRTPAGFVFIAKHGLDSLGASKVAAENAREMCQRHYEKACG